MSSKLKFIYVALFSFCLLFLFTGFATLTDTLNIDGDVNGTPQENVFITDVTTTDGDKVSLKGFYGTFLNQEITLNSDTAKSASYTVNLYNNNSTKQYYYEKYICTDLPAGVTVTIVEKNGSTTNSNIICSLIDADDNDNDELLNTDTFIVTYTYTGEGSVNIKSPIEFIYKELNDQLKIVFEYDNVEYVKYASKGDTVDGVTSYSDVIFDQIDVPINDTNRVARCDNGAIISTVAVDENNVNLKITNINKTGEVEGGTLGVKCKVYSSLTSAAKEDTSLAQLTPNNFILLQNCIVDSENVQIESTTDEIYVKDTWNYSFNLNSKTVELYNTLKNAGMLRIYDDNDTKGCIQRHFSTTESITTTSHENYLKLGVLAVEKCDLIQNLFDDSKLYIDNVILKLDDSDTFDNYKARVDSGYKIEYPAIVVGFEGIVEIINSELYSDFAYGVYKKSYYAGDYNNRLLNPTSDESKILVESSKIVCDYSNCVRFSDGKGIISLVDSYISTNENVAYSGVDGAYKSDPIFAAKHILEGLSGEAGSDSYENNPEYIGNLYQRFYRYATMEAKIYITGGTVVCNRIKSATEEYGHVNHFYSSNELNMRIFYTKSAKFKSLQRDGSFAEVEIMASTNDATFTYPLTMMCGNSAELTSSTDGVVPLYNSDGTLNRDHYLNNDGWYYVKKTTTGSTQVKKGNTVIYNTDSYISTAQYDNLTHMGKYVRVGDSFEFINFNNPAEFYLDISKYDNSTSFYPGLAHIDTTNGGTQADYVGFQYEFTFLASGDQNYYNIVNLGNLNGVLHIENYGTDVPKNYNVGIKYIDTSVTSVNMDQVEQRFTIMFYNHDEISNAATKANPYVFVSQFNSVLSYIDAQDDEDFDTGTNAAKTAPKFRDATMSYEQYLLSNVSEPAYIRNGWYLWQDEIAVYKTVDLTGLTVNGTVDKGDYTVKLSKHVIIQDDGILLQSDNTDGVGEVEGGNGVLNDYGWIRITTDGEFYGVRFTVKNYNPDLDPDSTEDDKQMTKTPWLFIRTYNSAGDYIVYDIEHSNATFGIWRPVIDGKVQVDFDENNKSNNPYYVITSGNTADEQVITIYFDCKYTNWDLHSITLQPFYDAASINSMLVTSIELIEPMEEKASTSTTTTE